MTINMMLSRLSRDLSANLARFPSNVLSLSQAPCPEPSGPLQAAMVPGPFSAPRGRCAVFAAVPAARAAPVLAGCPGTYFSTALTLFFHHQ